MSQPVFEQRELVTVREFLSLNGGARYIKALLDYLYAPSDEARSKAMSSMEKIFPRGSKTVDPNLVRNIGILLRKKQENQPRTKIEHAIRRLGDQGVEGDVLQAMAG